MDSLEALLREMFPNDRSAVDQTLQLLKSEPKYRDALLGLKASPPAVQAFVRTLVGMRPKAGSAQKASAEEGTSLHEQTESMRAQYREFVGTHITEYEEPWVLVPAVPPDLGQAIQAAGAAAYFTGQQFAQHAAAAAAVVPDAMPNTFKALQSAAPVSETIKILQKTTQNAAEIFGKKASPTLSRNSSSWLTNGGTVLTVGFLGYECYGHIRQYWNHQIDSYELAGKLLTSLASAAAAAAGAWSGATLLAGAGPWGVGFGALAGALIGSEIAKQATRTFFVTFFGTSRERALKDAYSVLGLSEAARPAQVRKQYLKLARESHPDKSGSHDRFVQVNCAYELIRAAKLAGA